MSMFAMQKIVQAIPKQCSMQRVWLLAVTVCVCVLLTAVPRVPRLSHSNAVGRGCLFIGQRSILL